MVDQRRWHPFLAAQENPTGTWSLLDAYDRVYGTIEIRRVSDDDVRYRVSFRGEVIGWSTPSASPASASTASSCGTTARMAGRSRVGARRSKRGDHRHPSQIG